MKTFLRLWRGAGFIILIMTVPVYAQENIAINFNSGYLGYGGNFPLNDNYDSEAVFTLFNIGMEHTSTNIGFEFSPYRYSNWTNLSESANDSTDMNHSFFNLNLYWNVVTLLDGFIYFGPFTSINYLFVGENVYWDKFIFTVGGQIGLRLSSGILNYNIVSAEMGYRNISGKSQYFVGAKVDILSFIVSLILAAGSERSQDSSSDRFR